VARRALAGRRDPLRPSTCSRWIRCERPGSRVSARDRWWDRPGWIAHLWPIDGEKAAKEQDDHGCSVGASPAMPAEKTDVPGDVVWW